MAIQIEGLQGVLERLEGVADTSKIGQAIEKACLLVETDAVKNAPKQDGILRQSITSNVEGTEGVVYSPLEYAPYVEYGTGLFSSHPMGGRKDVPWIYRDEKTGEFYATSGQKPQPYLMPALEQNKEKILEILQGAMKQK